MPVVSYHHRPRQDIHDRYVERFLFVSVLNLLCVYFVWIYSISINFGCLMSIDSVIARIKKLVYAAKLTNKIAKQSECFDEKKFVRDWCCRSVQQKRVSWKKSRRTLALFIFEVEMYWCWQNHSMYCEKWSHELKHPISEKDDISRTTNYKLWYLSIGNRNKRKRRKKRSDIFAVLSSPNDDRMF